MIDGLVAHPQAMTLADLRAMPSIVEYRTFECISTEIVRGDHLIGNQKWRGVRVSDLLDRAGATAEAKFIHWEAADGFRESIAIDVARLPDTFIAYEMADAPLPVEHGFPARVLIPGRFGMKQPKWLTRIELSDTDRDGYWVERGWDKNALVKVMSRIDSPEAGARVTAGQPFRVYGVANSGDRGISRVELTTDDGATWTAAELESRSEPLGPLTWVRWRATLTASRGGTIRVAVRATDSAGTVQGREETAPLPSGSTGWHAIRVVVDAASAAPSA